MGGEDMLCNIGEKIKTNGRHSMIYVYTGKSRRVGYWYMETSEWRVVGELICLYFNELL